MIPALVYGDLTAAVALDGPLAPLDRTPADLAWVLGGTGAGVDQSPSVTTQQQEQHQASIASRVLVREAIFRPKSLDWSTAQGP